MSDKDKPEKTGRDAAVAATADGHETGNTDFSLDIDRYLAPIPGDSPAGESLRYEGTYDSIQEARKEEPAELPQGIWERELKKANWDQVAALCLEALETRTKDYQVAAWLVEALICLHGHTGCKEGLKLMLALAENFWDDAHPRLEAEDLSGRLAPIIWLNEKVSLKLKFVPITSPKSMDSQPYSFADWESANLLEKLAVKEPDAVTRAESQGRATRAKFLGSVMFTSGQFYIAQAGEIEETLGLLADLNALLDEKCGKEAPSLNMIKENLENILGLVNNFLKEKQIELPAAEIVVEDDGAEQTVAAEAGQGDQLVTLSIRSRDEAYRMLAAAADYLLIHEPHSPTPHLVRRAVSWGQMSLTELLRELIQDDSNLRQIFNLLGVKVATPVREETIE
jgi:type VI secretion system ImpA family protein